jgi:hypothetical protein
MAMRQARPGASVNAHRRLGGTSGLELETFFLGAGGLVREPLLQGFPVLRQIEALDLVLLVHPQR